VGRLVIDMEPKRHTAYYTAIAKALISNADGIINAIDRYLAKADEDLEKTLDNEGYADAEGTVGAINDLAEDIADILSEQTDNLVETLESCEGKDWKTTRKKVDKMLDEDETAEMIEDAALEMYIEVVPELATSYMQGVEGDMAVDTLRQRTSDWLVSWSQRLGELMKTTSHNQITNAIQETIDNGDDIATLTRRIQEGGWRSEYYQAKRVAVTEVLRAHSVAQEEAIQQSPATDRKIWRHTGAHKNQPRQNHVDMDGQIVPKDQPFEMKGIKGGTYSPMYPRDPSLPPEESINCHCIHYGVANDEILGMTYEERRKMQQEIIDGDDGEWEKELAAENKARAGIEPYDAMKDFESKSRDEQIKSIGGKAKMGLYDAGLVTDEETLKKVKTTSLKKLSEDGIFTVDSSGLKHSTVGEFAGIRNPALPAGGKNGGNMKSGGHSQANLDELTKKGISYKIEKTYENGVRIGGVENHTSKEKRLGQTGQSWFPENWDSDKVRAAGTYTVNKSDSVIELQKDGKLTGYEHHATFDGVKVIVRTDLGHNPGSIYPDKNQGDD
jgi:hypothetical protein